MTTVASQITSLTVVYSIVYSDADQRIHQSSASLAIVRGIHRDRWIPRTKGQLRGKCFHLMTSSWRVPSLVDRTEKHKIPFKCTIYIKLFCDVSNTTCLTPCETTISSLTDVSMVFRQKAYEWQLKYRQSSNMSRTKFQNIKISSCNCLWPIHWSRVLSREWTCYWSNADRRCFNYVSVISNFIALKDTTCIRCLTVVFESNVMLHWYNLFTLSGGTIFLKVYDEQHVLHNILNKMNQCALDTLAHLAGRCFRCYWCPQGTVQQPQLRTE